jgi:hypothetical protein
MEKWSGMEESGGKEKGMREGKARKKPGMVVRRSFGIWQGMGSISI